MTINILYRRILLTLVILGSGGCASTGQSQLEPNRDDQVVANKTGQPEVVQHRDDLKAKDLDRSDCHTAPSIQTGRYSAVLAKPTWPQRHILDVTVTVTVPEDRHTIGQSIRYLLRRSGYRLSASLQPDSRQLLDKPLPAIHRRLGPMTLKDALTVLMAPAFVLVDDPVHRVIHYEKVKGQVQSARSATGEPS